MKFDKDLSRKKVIIATHFFMIGAAQDLQEYLLINKVGKLLFIEHPLFLQRNLKNTGYRLYKKGHKIKERIEKFGDPPYIIAYFLHALFNLIYVVNAREKWDLYVGSNNLNAITGVILQKLGFVDKTIYYVIDYNPKRFQNRLINFIYHVLDRLCVRFCNETWNLSPRMEIARKKYFGFESPRQKVVPVGIWIKRIRKLNISHSEKHTLVFVGHITKKQGIQHVLEALKIIKNKIKDIKFLIIGSGDYLEKLEETAKKLEVQNHVKFTGHFQNQEDIEKILCRCSVAIAPYEKYVDGELSFTYFADPSKIKSYLSCGLPVLLTNVTHNAKALEAQKCGIIINDNKKSIARAVVTLMRDGEKLKEYRKNAISYSLQYDWNEIFKKNLPF